MPALRPRRDVLSRLLLGVLLSALGAASLAAQDSGEASRRPLVRPWQVSDRRCAPEGGPCIAEATYAADVCRVIEEAARAEGLDPGFLARLLWRESLFDAAAVSPAGAQGIAQFMPGTAALRNLDDPFNPAEAILASADYLAELRATFGNLGLAAAAYNAGEDGAARYLAGARGLPGETRAYVAAITGHPAEAWREALDGGPEPQATYALAPGPFPEACLAMAERGPEPEMRPDLMPWGVVIAAQESRAATEAQVARVQRTHGALLRGERIDFARTSVPGTGWRTTAQVGRATRGEADVLCAKLSAARAACMVLRN